MIPGEPKENPHIVASDDWDSIRYQRDARFVWELGEPLVQVLDPQPDERILDIGCGLGQLTAKIAQSGAEVLGVDASPSMIEQARRNYPQIKFEVVDATRMGFHAEFDAAFSNAALHWILDASQVASRVYNALKPGGRLVAEFGGEGNISAIVRTIFRAREEVNASPLDRFPWYFPSVSEYRSVLRAHGLVVTDADLFPRPTQLAGGERGLGDWLRVFARPLIEGLSRPEKQEVVSLVEEQLRDEMFEDGSWILDYVRIRVRAERQ